MNRIFQFRTLALFILAVFVSACSPLLHTAPSGVMDPFLVGVIDPFLTPDAPLPFDPAVTVGRLDNGLTYYIRENHQPRGRAELRLVVNAGSVLEDPDQQGLAHFLEHMAFNGTEHFEKQGLVDFLEGIGMRFGPDLNAYTSFDETVYMLQVPSKDAEILDKAFLILEDWAHGMKLDPEEVEKERGVVIEEWRLSRGAAARIRDKEFPVIFRGSQYALRLPIGKKEVLDGFKRDTLERFYRDWYRPGLVAVVAVGDFDKVKVEGLIKDHFSTFGASASPRERAKPPVPAHAETLVSAVTDPEATGSDISVYFKRDISPTGSHRDYRQALLESLYTGMLNSRLRELTRSADPPFISAHSSSGRIVRTKSAFSLSASAENGKTLDGLKALLREAERVRRHGFIPSEFMREKDSVLTATKQAYNERNKTESSTLAGEYARAYLGEEPAPGIEYEYMLIKRYLPGITLAEINALSDFWMRPEERVVLISAPEKEGLPPLPGDDEVLAAFGSVSGSKIVPYSEDVSTRPLIADEPEPGSVVEEEAIEALGVTEWRLSNGVRVLLKPTDFKDDQVIFTAYSPGGNSLVGDGAHVAALTAASLVRESGVGGFGRIELEKKLAGTTAGVSPYISELYEGIGGSAAPEDLLTMFRLIYLYFTAPGEDQDAFDSYKKRRRAVLENRALMPETHFSDMITTTLSQDHFRRRPWTVELLEEMDLARSVEFYKDRFSDAGDFTFFFVGNFEPGKLRPLVERYLGSLPSQGSLPDGGRRESWRDVGVQPPKGVIEKEVRKGLEPKSRVRIVFTGPFEWTLKNRYDMHSMLRVLNIRLREVLREEIGGTYSVGAWAQPARYPRERYRVSVSFGSDPARVGELTAEVFRLIKELKEKGADESYIRKVKEIQRRARETSLRRNGFWLGRLSSYHMHGDDLLDILKYDKLVDALSSDAVKDAANRYFNMDNYVRVVLYPEGD